LTAVLLSAALAAGQEPRTPETRTLTAAEAALALERDWLFQAMGEPRLERTAKELGWAAALAERLSRTQPAPDLASELRERDVLRKRLTELSDSPGAVASQAAFPRVAVKRGERRNRTLPKTRSAWQRGQARGRQC
jgi:hypothetical protein